MRERYTLYFGILSYDYMVDKDEHTYIGKIRVVRLNNDWCSELVL